MTLELMEKNELQNLTEWLEVPFLRVLLLVIWNLKELNGQKYMIPIVLAIYVFCPFPFCSLYRNYCSCYVCLYEAIKVEVNVILGTRGDPFNYPKCSAILVLLFFK